MAEIPSERIAFVHRRWARALGWLAFAAAVIPLLAYCAFGTATHPILDTIVSNGALVALPLAFLSVLAGRDPFRARGTLRREGDELVIAKGRSERRIRVSDVKGGIIVPERDRALVELILADGNQIDARVDDVPAAQTLLKDLEVDVGNQRCRVQIADRTAARVVALAAPVGMLYFGAIFFTPIFFPFLFHAPAALLLVLVVGLYALASALLQTLIAPPDVTIGTDGLSFHRGLAETFIPFTNLHYLRTVGLGVRLHLRDGRTILLPSIAGVSNARLEALKLRVREAISLSGAAPHHALDQLDRAGRTIPAWRAALASLTKKGTGYRAAGLSPEDLEALLVSPEASAERRLGAALALSEAQHPGAPTRIRIAAAQCASERLRVALEKVSDGEADDEALAEALEMERRS